MSGVLLLNATYEAIRIISLKRAVVLILQEKAEIIEAANTEVRSANLSVPKPEVIRLKYYVKIPYKKKITLSNKAILNRDKYQCAYTHCNPQCIKKATTVDHVHPKSKGGKHEWENVVAACKKCNSKKDDKTLKDLGWTLKFKPEAPKAKHFLVVGSPEKAEAWSAYLEYAQ